MRYAGEWKSTVERMGRWIDFENDYKTLYPSFMESVYVVVALPRPRGPRGTSADPLPSFDSQLVGLWPAL
jgi:hypothetical protein